MNSYTQIVIVYILYKYHFGRFCMKISHKFSVSKKTDAACWNPQNAVCCKTYTFILKKNHNFPLHDSNIKACSHLSFVPSGGAKYVIFWWLHFQEHSLCIVNEVRTFE